MNCFKSNCIIVFSSFFFFCLLELVPPLVPMSVITVNVSDTVTLECQDQNPVSEQIVFVDLEGNMQAPPLVITSISRDQAGTYLCIVSRNGETLSTSVEVFVMCELSINLSISQSFYPIPINQSINQFIQSIN